MQEEEEVGEEREDQELQGFGRVALRGSFFNESGAVTASVDPRRKRAAVDATEATEKTSKGPRPAAGAAVSKRQLVSKTETKYYDQRYSLFSKYCAACR